MANESEQLMREMRDYLAQIAESLRPQYWASVNQRLGQRATDIRKAVGESGRRWDALARMDGETTQTQIGQAVSMDLADLSKFVKGMRAIGVVETQERKPPRCSLTPAELEAVRRGTD